MPKRRPPVEFHVHFLAPDGHVMSEAELRAWGRSPRVAAVFGRLLADAERAEREREVA